MNDDAARGPHDSIVQRKIYRVPRDSRCRPDGERFIGRVSYRLAVTGRHFIQVKTQIPTTVSQIEKELLQGKIVQHHDAWIFDHRLINSRMITMVIAHMIDDRVEGFQPLK